MCIFLSSFALCLMQPLVIISLEVFTVSLMLQDLNFSIACCIHPHPSSSCAACIYAPFVLL
jgi:hypothetical protein